MLIRFYAYGRIRRIRKMRYNPTMNAEIVLPLDRMTIDEKMEAVYTIWDDILSHPEQIKWPEWHAAYLRDLKESIDNGNEELVDFELAREMLLKEPL